MGVGNWLALIPAAMPGHGLTVGAVFYFLG